MDRHPSGDFEGAARRHREGSVFVELWLFLGDNKKWWLLPILLVLALFGLLAVLAGSGAAPFIYTLF